MTKRNRAAQQAYNKAYLAQHGERIRAQKRQHYAAKRDEQRAKCRAYYAANRAAQLRRAAAYRDTNHEQCLEATQRWRQENPDVVLAHTIKRRARIAGAPQNDLTPAQWREIKAAYDSRCVYCGRKLQRLTQDHITPLSKGGSHALSNVVPACQLCNSKKYTGAVLVPVQPLLLTVAKAAQLTSSSAKHRG